MTLTEVIIRATETIQDGLSACEEECVRRSLVPYGGETEGVQVQRRVAGVLVRGVTVLRYGEIVGRWTVSLVPKGAQLVTLAVPC